MLGSPAWQRYTGGDPRLLRQNLSLLEKAGKRVWLRIPAVAGVNDTEAELSEIASLLRTFSFAERVDTLPIFAHAARKYQALGREQGKEWFSANPAETAKNMANRLAGLSGIPIGTLQ